MKLQIPLTLVFTCLLFTRSIAQNDPGITFNRVKPADFSLNNITVDTSEGAVIIADIGKSRFEGNTQGWFTLVYEHKRRIRIIDKKGFDLATVQIPLYRSKNSTLEEKLESLKASTYNLENGQVIETKLDKDAVFKDQLDDNHLVKKFTMPAVKEGAIIEYSYQIKSDYLFNIQPWSFQGAYPRMWSEYKVSIPSFFKYVVLSQGYFPFHIKSKEDIPNTYTVREINSGADDLYHVPSNDLITRWVIKDIPAMKEESFTSSLSNHLSKLEFQLAAYDFPNAPYKSIMGNWKTISTELLADKDFGADLANSNNWVNNEIKAVSAGAPTKLEEAKKIYTYVQSTIKNKGTRGIYLTQTLKETFRNKSGYVPDINMLLTMILTSQGFEAVPVLISTRSNGTANELYPLIGKFNYVICKVTIDNTNYFLDASQPWMGFNKLPSYCYNGDGRSIASLSTAENFIPDSLSESKFTSVNLQLNEKEPQSWKGNLSSRLGYYESSSIREDILEKGKEAFIKKLQQSYTGEYTVDEIELAKLDVYEEPLQVNYKLNIENQKSDFIYFSPMIKEGMAENVFKSQVRRYPIEMPYKTFETYLLKIEIPEGYVIDELPKSARVRYNEDQALFEYLISKTDKEINLRTVLKFERATFASEDYESLRSFFDFIVKKHAEQIVFKKK
jgi:hypothetical protein